GSGGVAVTVTVAVEEPLHHFSGRRDDLREFERLRLAPRTVLRNTEPAAKLLADRARYRSYSQHRNIPLQKTRGNCHSFDRGLRSRERVGTHPTVHLCKLRPASRPVPPPDFVHPPRGPRAAQAGHDGLPRDHRRLLAAGYPPGY